MSSPVVYPVVRAGARVVLRALGPVRVLGVENLPREGGALLLPNHQSALDPFLVQGWAPRPVRSMTKSTQFGSGFMQWIVPRLGGFPVRRYRTDAQAVRVTLRLLGEGEVVCIYPEGERSWDARLQPFRTGSLRVALAAAQRGIPVIPVGIRGMYDVFPRWGKPRRTRAPLQVRFGRPLALGPFADRAARDAALPALRARLEDRLLDLSGEREIAAVDDSIEWPFDEESPPPGRRLGSPEREESHGSPRNERSRGF
jgi:1-acyl-sn-glycerol-3-phosphate acyltransferase